jgi:predicted PurR-regulated permease PerM
MNSNDITKGIIKAVAYIIGVALLLLFIYKIQSVILYIIIAAIISLIGLPIVSFLKTKLKYDNNNWIIIESYWLVNPFSC